MVATSRGLGLTRLICLRDAPEYISQGTHIPSLVRREMLDGLSGGEILAARANRRVEM
jgi:hypothetical protein